MNKTLLMALLAIFCMTISAKKKAKPILNCQIEVKSSPSEKGKLIKFRGNASEYNPTWIKFFNLDNGTNERIYIEWENARLSNSKVVFGDDRIITMGLPKADEAVSAGSSSIVRDITGQDYIDAYIPLYEPKELKKAVGVKDVVKLMIPIRYMDNTIEEFQLDCLIGYEMPIETE